MDRTVITIEWRKWDGRLARTATGRVLGQDRYGMWLGSPPEVEAVPYGDTFVILIPSDGWWIARHFADGWKVDIGTPAEWHGDLVRFVDLDLDVRVLNGIVWVEDEEEFDERRQAYPDDVAATAVAETERIRGRLEAMTEPFTSVGDTWLEIHRR